MDKLYLITYESAHWCGASDTKVVVYAESEEDALTKAEDHMEESMWEMFADEYSDDGEEFGEFTDESKVSVTHVEEFTPQHEEWKYYIDEIQSQFYPLIN